MKNLLIIAIVVSLSFLAWQKFSSDNQIEALYDEPYIVVYGKENCGWTQKYLNDLRRDGIDPIFESVNNREISDELYDRMKKAGLKTRRYNLPVIDVNGHILIRPEFSTILSEYGSVK